MTTDHELTPDQLEAVLGGSVPLGIAIGVAICILTGSTFPTDTTPTNIVNGINTLLNNPPAGW